MDKELKFRLKFKSFDLIKKCIKWKSVLIQMNVLVVIILDSFHYACYEMCAVALRGARTSGDVGGRLLVGCSCWRLLFIN